MWGDLVHCPSTLGVSAKVSSSVAAVVTCRGTRPTWLEGNAKYSIYHLRLYNMCALISLVWVLCIATPGLVKR